MNLIPAVVANSRFDYPAIYRPAKSGFRSTRHYVRTGNMNKQMTTIRQISEKEVPVSMLLHADPSEKCIDKYLPQSKCFGAFVEDSLVGVCVTNSNEAGVWEVFNIVVIPEKQKQGIGTKLLKFVIRYFENIGEKTIELGTGTFGYQFRSYAVGKT